MKKLSYKSLLYYIPMYGFISSNDDARKPKTILKWHDVYLCLVTIIGIVYTFSLFMALLAYTEIKIYVEKTWDFETVVKVLLTFIMISFIATMITLGCYIRKSLTKKK